MTTSLTTDERISESAGSMKEVVKKLKKSVRKAAQPAAIVKGITFRRSTLFNEFLPGHLQIIIAHIPHIEIKK